MLLEINLPRVLSNRAALGSDSRGGLAEKLDMNLRLHVEHTGFGRVSRPYRRPICFRNPELDLLRGVGVSRLLIENQAASLHVNGIFQFEGGRLIWPG